ncbi:FAD-dependent oxidoreductase [Tundrisphaera lichenicola]|uniref:FAD-dependent oxidoreductase n=1 Tax=Tundrisphaera lichenicola TaxID=2029860 RepID=UPI003EBBF2C9
MIRHSLILTLLLPFAAPSMAAEPKKAEVVVYGASAGGVIAAVSAGREGKSTILIEPGRHIGGMVSGGLGATDHGNRAAIGGISREFFRRVLDHYRETYAADSIQVKECSDGFRFEPHVATLVFRAMLEEAKVQVVFESGLERVEKEGTRITSIRTTRGYDFAAKVFIDASYEGDLMARAGVKYAIGREGREQYGESIAGVQARSPAHQWPIAVPGLGPDGKPLPTIQPGLPGPAGSGDAKTQAYNYRLCMTDRPENRFPFPKPPGYDPARFDLLARYLALKPDLKVGQLMHPSRMPNGKTDTNNNGPFSTDHIGGNWDYPEADAAKRRKIVDDHIDYVQGFFYFLSNDPRVPKALHDEMAGWGLAEDEFVDTGHWPHQLYVRECRRMLGSYVMTQVDILEELTKDDSVGLGSYNTDSHHVQRFIQPDGSVLNEGDFQVRVTPYAIPYRSLIPKAEECSNLLVPVCMSASHVAYGTVRMEPVYMILGHASGLAAALAIDSKSSVQTIESDRLVSKLREQGSVLSPVGLPSASGPGFRGIDPSKLVGIVVDDAQASIEGEWAVSTSTSPFVGEGYHHDGARADGSSRLRFIPKFPEAGRYEVRLHFPPASNRATNTPVVIHSKEGERTIRVNQRRSLKDGQPLSLGVFGFEPGGAGWVEIGAEGADGHVIADAVQFVPVP